MKRDFGPVEHAQQIITSLKEPFERTIGRGEAGFSREDAFEPGLELSRAFFAGLLLVEPEIPMSHQISSLSISIARR